MYLVTHLIFLSYVWRIYTLGNACRNSCWSYVPISNNHQWNWDFQGVMISVPIMGHKRYVKILSIISGKCTFLLIIREAKTLHKSFSKTTLGKDQHTLIEQSRHIIQSSQDKSIVGTILRHNRGNFAVFFKIMRHHTATVKNLDS